MKVVDRDEAVKVIANAIDNAEKLGDDSLDVAVSSLYANGYVLVTVTDREALFDAIGDHPTQHGRGLGR